MRTMTCKEMGGPCDAKLSGETPEELMEMGMKHVEIAHPEMAIEVKNLSDEENRRWYDDFMQKWSSAPQT